MDSRNGIMSSYRFFASSASSVTVAGSVAKLKLGQPGKFHPLGIPTVYDRVCQQALLNRLEPIFDPVFDDASFGYRPGRSAKDALRKVWRELQEGREWIVDADLQDFFDPVNHDKLMAEVGKRVTDQRVLSLIRSYLRAGSHGARLGNAEGDGHAARWPVVASAVESAA